MQETARRHRNRSKLDELHPAFRDRVISIVFELEAKGYRPRIQEAWRSPEDQLAAYQGGYSKLQFGFHNVTGPDGVPESLAVDILDDDQPLHPSRKFLLLLAAAARKVGLVTGIRWGLPTKLRRAIDHLISTNNWDAPAKLGWDPCHVQVAGLTVAQAQSGRRPESP